MIEVLVVAALMPQETRVCDAEDLATDWEDESQACVEPDHECALSDAACKTADLASQANADDRSIPMEDQFDYEIVDIYPAWENRIVKGWHVYAQSDSAYCIMGMLYEDKTLVYFEFDAKNTRTVLGFTNNDATSLQAGQTVILDLTVGNNEFVHSDDDWEDTKFTVGVSENGRSFFSEWLDDEFLDDVSRYQKLLIETSSGNVIAVYRLDGTAAAWKALKECGFTRAGLNINDPFLQ